MSFALSDEQWTLDAPYDLDQMFATSTVFPQPPLFWQIGPSDQHLTNLTCFNLFIAPFNLFVSLVRRVVILDSLGIVCYTFRVFQRICSSYDCSSVLCFCSCSCN